MYNTKLPGDEVTVSHPTDQVQHRLSTEYIYERKAFGFIQPDDVRSRKRPENREGVSRESDNENLLKV